jgi:hypothetical protein
MVKLGAYPQRLKPKSKKYIYRSGKLPRHPNKCETIFRACQIGGDPANAGESDLLFVWLFLFFNRHVFLAFHVFGFFVAGDNLNSRVLALFGRYLLGRGLGRLAQRHRLIDYSTQ